jgi:hypothetical protein
MEKREAAEFLGVSMRTLERIAASGKLKQGKALKKTRPVVVYDEGELAKLKEELQATRPAEVFRRLNTPKPADAIGFRLDPFYIKRLTEEGEKNGMSAGEYARRLVIRGLEGQGSDQDFKTLRSNLADMFYIILVSKMGVSEAEANEVIKSLAGGN